MKKPKRIYIAGPMRGKRLLNFPAFDEARDLLNAAGYIAVSPADMDRARGITPETYDEATFDAAAAMRADIKAILKCDGMFLLPGWPGSTGARTEVAVNQALGHPFYVRDYVTQKPGLLDGRFVFSVDRERT